MSNPFHPRPKIRASGDADIEDIYRAVGRALVTWEWVENHFAHLFGTIISPPRGSIAAQRAYGSIVTSRARRDMLTEAAGVYFRKNPRENLEQMFTNAIKLYRYGCDRRNDIAHGVVMSGPSPHSGYYLAANLYTSKRNIKTGSPYFYTASQIDEFSKQFDSVAQLASGVRQVIQLGPRASEQKMLGAHNNQSTG